jgi:hypothetical protein
MQPGKPSKRWTYSHVPISTRRIVLAELSRKVLSVQGKEESEMIALFFEGARSVRLPTMRLSTEEPRQ